MSYDTNASLTWGRIARWGASSFLAKVVAVLLGFVTYSYIGKAFGAAAVGVIASLASGIAIFGLFPLLGFNSSVLKVVPDALVIKGKTDASVLCSLMYLFVVLSTMVAVLSIALLWQFGVLDRWFEEPAAALVVVCAFFFGTLNFFLISAVRALGLRFTFIFLQVIQPAFLLILVVFFVPLQSDNTQLLIAYVVANILAFLINNMTLIGHLTFPNSKTVFLFITTRLNQIIRTSIPMQVNSMVFACFAHVDVLLVFYLTSPNEAGVYAVARKFSSVLSMFLSSINMLLAPNISSLFAQQRYDNLYVTMTNLSKVSAITALVIFLMFVFYGELFLGFFGTEFVDGYAALLILALGGLISAVFGSVGNFLNMTGFASRFSKILVATVLIHLCLSVSMISLYGSTGAASAVLLSTLCWNTFAARLIYLEHNVWLGFSVFKFR